MSELRIGLVYETFETYPRRGSDPIDAHVEYEPESTIEALEAAIVQLGHRPVRLGSPRALFSALGQKEAHRTSDSDGDGVLKVDAAFNLAEGFGGRNREAWAPILLEMAAIPTLGSDALSLSLSLDKAWTNRWLAAIGIPVAAQVTMSTTHDAEKGALPTDFPLFVKPRWEGTAKGIRLSSRVHSRSELAREVGRIAADYHQPALVEAFLPGAEYTVTLIGNDPPQVYPALQRALELKSRIGLHAVESIQEHGDIASAFEHVTDGNLEPALEARLADLAIRSFEALECRDYARIDFRLDAEGDPVFLEINPLPTFAPAGSFGILAELEGCSLSEILGRCVRAGLIRLGLEVGTEKGNVGHD